MFTVTNSERKQLAKKIAKMNNAEREALVAESGGKLHRHRNSFMGSLLFYESEQWYECDGDKMKLICTVPKV